MRSLQELPMRFYPTALAAAFLSIGCAGPRHSPPTEETTASFIRDYEQKYAAYRIAPDQVPASNLQKVVNLRSPQLWKNASAELTLHPGKRTKNDSGRFRTSSRYELRDRSGNLLGTAESVLAREDLGEPDLSPQVRVAFDPTSRKVLVVEEHSWSVERIFFLSLDGKGQEARYARIPTRQAIDPVPHYEIVAFADGMLFIKQDGSYYAFPVEALPAETKLDYSIGAMPPSKPSEQAIATLTKQGIHTHSALPQELRHGLALSGAEESEDDAEQVQREEMVDEAVTTLPA